MVVTRRQEKEKNQRILEEEKRKKRKLDEDEIGDLLDTTDDMDEDTKSGCESSSSPVNQRKRAPEKGKKKMKLEHPPSPRPGSSTWPDSHESDGFDESTTGLSETESLDSTIIVISSEEESQDVSDDEVNGSDPNWSITDLSTTKTPGSSTQPRKCKQKETSAEERFIRPFRRKYRLHGPTPRKSKAQKFLEAKEKLRLQATRHLRRRVTLKRSGQPVRPRPTPVVPGLAGRILVGENSVGYHSAANDPEEDSTPQPEDHQDIDLLEPDSRSLSRGDRVSSNKSASEVSSPTARSSNEDPLSPTISGTFSSTPRPSRDVPLSAKTSTDVPLSSKPLERNASDARQSDEVSTSASTANKVPTTPAPSNSASFPVRSSTVVSPATDTIEDQDRVSDDVSQHSDDEDHLADGPQDEMNPLIANAPRGNNRRRLVRLKKNRTYHKKDGKQNATLRARKRRRLFIRNLQGQNIPPPVNPNPPPLRPPQPPLVVATMAAAVALASAVVAAAATQPPPPVTPLPPRPPAEAVPPPPPSPPPEEHQNGDISAPPALGHQCRANENRIQEIFPELRRPEHQDVPEEIAFHERQALAHRQWQGAANNLEVWRGEQRNYNGDYYGNQDYYNYGHGYNHNYDNNNYQNLGNRRDDNHDYENRRYNNGRHPNYYFHCLFFKFSE